eukprot:6460337-Amphidinium_carterae.3
MGHLWHVLVLQVKLAIALFGSTSMDDPVFLRGLSPLRFREAVGAIPVIVDAHFHFPSAAQSTSQNTATPLKIEDYTCKGVRFHCSFALPS